MSLTCWGHNSVVRDCVDRHRRTFCDQPRTPFARYGRKVLQNQEHSQRRCNRIRRRVAASEDVEYLEGEDVVDPDYQDAEYYVEDVEDEGVLYEEEEDLGTWETEPLSQPRPHADVQQTLSRSFFVSNFTHHSDEEARLRVRPALAGEGRYFVFVPAGTLQDGEDILAEIEETKAAAGGSAEEPQESSADGEQQTASSTPPEDDEEDEKIVPCGSEENVVRAVLDNAVSDPGNSIFTTLQEGENRIFAAETLLSALEACGVDNARIEIEGNGELPVYDGSAAGFAYLIKWAGVRTAPGLDGAPSTPKQNYSPHKVITVREGDSFISLIPSSGMRISYGVDHTAEAPVIGKQWASWSPTDEEELHFRWALAPARPYFTSPTDRLEKLAQGFFKASYEELTVVADGKGFNRMEELRFTDEPARRRLLDFVGDLSLLSEGGRGGIPAGHIVAFQASKALHLRFLKAVKKICSEEKSQ